MSQANAEMKTRAELISGIFDLHIRWDRKLELWIAECMNWILTVETRNSGSDSTLSIVSGSGTETKNAIADLWNKLTGLPEDGRIRVTDSAPFSPTSDQLLRWIEYHWNGESFVEVERHGHGYDIEYAPS